MIIDVVPYFGIVLNYNKFYELFFFWDFYIRFESWNELDCDVSLKHNLAFTNDQNQSLGKITKLIAKMLKIVVPKLFCCVTT